ncbi:YdcF family protein [Anabaena sp. UHCC 0187]|uniref:YdcF family protein n=1 Tax=Anabaena sp. UHCC 0187 TaxID=2590018 RepID=UPI001444DA15|nr:ElyC/SanA/YdcF family protein [Anabaena sp. UHCC 0187]MTJ14362.1 YdcF family protein [Anabaena sp. UHCC 0187]
MFPKFNINLLIHFPGKFNKSWRLLQKLWWGLRILLISWLVITSITLVFACLQPVDGFFVLGGSIRREIHVAQLAKQSPYIPILISRGSQDPCIWLIFQREGVDFQQVNLENCANSTFDNFYYGTPILQSWGVHKVKLITSGTHTFRAKLMAQIILGSHGIWVESEVVKEKGVPANREYWYKTILDIIRSLGWAVLSQFIQTQCPHIIKLVDVDMPVWEQKGFRCEYQGGLKR